MMDVSALNLELTCFELLGLGDGRQARPELLVVISLQHDPVSACTIRRSAENLKAFCNSQI